MDFVVFRNNILLEILSSKLNNIQELTKSLHLTQNIYSREPNSGISIVSLTNYILFLANKVSTMLLFRLLKPSPLNLTETS